MQITALAVFLDGNKILLEKRRNKEDNYAGLWATPGGHKNPKEKITTTLKREMKEELNIKLNKIKPSGIIKDKDPTSKEIFHHHMFLCTTKDKIKKTTEQKAIAWHPLNKLPKTTAKYLNKVKKLI